MVLTCNERAVMLKYDEYNGCMKELCDIDGLQVGYDDTLQNKICD